MFMQHSSMDRFQINSGMVFYCRNKLEVQGSLLRTKGKPYKLMLLPRLHSAGLRY
jgi:hypothetical protein